MGDTAQGEPGFFVDSTGSRSLQRRPSAAAPVVKMMPQSQRIFGQDALPAQGKAVVSEYRLHLIGRLAEHLLGREGQTLQNIKTAAGLVTSRVIGSSDHSEWRATGTASSLAKARTLVEARLSQTPLMLFVSIRLKSSDAYIGLEPFDLPLSLSKDSYVPKGAVPYVLVESTRLPSPRMKHDFLQGRECIATPGSEKSEGSAIAFVPQQHQYLQEGKVIGDQSQCGIPQLGEYNCLREAYVSAVASQIAEQAEQQSFTKMKIVLGRQLFYPKNGFDTQQCADSTRFTSWEFGGPGEHIKPEFSSSLSKASVDRIVELVLAKGFHARVEKEHVRILHLDRSRVQYVMATADVIKKSPEDEERSQQERGIKKSGTLSLVKCSTLPSKPFFLSVCTPASPTKDCSDLRIKLLSNKAATSPSQDISVAVSQATWALTASDEFAVLIDLPETRFSPDETTITYTRKTAYETDMFRVTLSERRQAGQKGVWYECELAQKTLSEQLLQSVVLRRQVNTSLLERLVEEFIELALSLTDA